METATYVRKEPGVPFIVRVMWFFLIGWHVTLYGVCVVSWSLADFYLLDLRCFKRWVKKLAIHLNAWGILICLSSS